LGIALAIVEHDGALPAALLVGVEFPEVGDDLLPRPRLGANALDEAEVRVRRAGLGPRGFTEKHCGLPDPGKRSGKV